MKRILFLVVALVLSATVYANLSHSYDLGVVEIFTRNNFSALKLGGAHVIGNPGQPALPHFGVKLLLPLGNEATGVRVLRSNPRTFTLDKMIEPLQQHIPLSMMELAEFVQPDPSIYELDASFPKDLHNGVITEFLSGHPIAFTAVCPFDYNPVRRELTYYSSITVEIDYQPSSRATAALSLLKEDHHVAAMLARSVDNDSALPYYEHRNQGFEYLIIGDAAKLANWQPLMDLYTMMGMNVYYKPVQEINATGTGADLQEKIRNYIIGFYNTNSLRFALLAGDVEVIPHRGFYVNMGTGSQMDADIPADMYYNCLDGNWNTDGDAYWGEQFETDMVPEFALGRICYNNDSEIEYQIGKIFSYLMTPVENSTKSSLFVGEWLWDGPTWGGDYMDEMIGGASINGYATVGVPTSWNISTLYDRTYGAADSWGANQIRPLLSQGANLVNHLGHSATTYNMRLSNNQATATTITNNGIANNFSIYFTQGCYAGSFDNRDTGVGQYGADCITEKFTALPTSAVGMISHSRYGWGMMGSTNGASQYLHRQYIDAIFGEHIHELGYTLVDTKIDVIPFINQQPVMYWVLFETNLFGDPAMKIWTETPQHINAQIPSYWGVGLNNYQIATNAPGASFRMKQGSATIASSQADGSGLIEISLLSSLNPGQYELYINAPNFYSYQSTVVVTASESPYIVCSVVDTDTEDNMHLTDQIYSLDVNVKNVGLIDQDSSGTLSLVSASPNVTVLSAPISFNSIASGDSTLLDAQFQIRVHGAFADHTRANLSFVAQYDGYSNQSTSYITLNAPNLQLLSHQIVNSGGLIMPGDSPSVNLTLHNSGSGTAQSPMMLIMTDNPNIEVSILDLYTQPILPGETVTITGAFSFNVSQNMEIGTSAEIQYVLITENDPEDNGIISFHIGMVNYGFEPNFQNWESAALSASFVNQWHRSSYRNNTPGGTFSAKFGGQGAADYASSAHGALISPDMALGTNSILKFYHWMDAEDHDTPGYAWDGGIVQMSLNGGVWTQIVPVGGYPYRIFSNTASPFAANTFCYSGSHGWQEASFDLSQHSGNVRIRFIFGSDGYVTGEGWYIDDVHIESEYIVSNDESTAPSTQFKLLGNYPNPFNPSTTIRFSSPVAPRAEISIFNVRGQKVQSISLENLSEGVHNVNWDGRDESGNGVGSGVYYYKIKVAGAEQGSRMILMK